MAASSDCLTDDELALLADGKANRGLLARLDAHVQSCASCRELVASLARELPPATVAGERFGRYVLDEVLGSGAMGIVYAARDPYLNRKIAIKVLHPQAGPAGADARARLLKEARAIARFTHPNVVAVHDVGVETDHVFFAMEHVDGQTLGQWLAAARRSVPEVLAVCLQAARGLAAAHRAGVVHRDFKPANVLVGKDGRVLVGDFGLAHVPDAAPESVDGDDGLPLDVARTATGAVLGTPAYMAPEQLRGASDARSDQWSFAVVLFEALHGRRPFAGATAAELRENVLAGHVVEGGPDHVPGSVRRAIRRALSADPAARFPSMDALIAALERRPLRATLWLAPAAGAVGVAVALVGLRGGHSAAAVAPGPTVAAMRRVTFDPGCEEFPSFFPDGKSVVFDADADGGYSLFRMDLETGERRRLTHAPGWDYAAQVSPDGTKILYKHNGPDNREVRVVDAAGDEAAAPVGLGRHQGYPVWTRDARALLSGFDDGEIIAMAPVAGAAPTHLGHAPPGTEIEQLAALPSGGIAVTYAAAHISSVGELAADGSVVTRETPIHRAENSLAAAPRIDAYFYTREGATGSILVRRSAGGGPAVVLPEISPRMGITFAPDGARAVWSTCRGFESWGRARGERDLERLSSGDWSEGDVRYLDAGHVLITSQRSGRYQVSVADLATHEVRPLAAAGSHDAAAAPDGRTIAFLDPDRGPGLWLMSVAGGAPARLTQGTGDILPAVARDGRRVVFQRRDAEHGIRIYAVAPGAEPRLLVEAQGEQAAVSPIDDTVVFVSNSDGKMRVMRTDLASAPARPIPDLPAAEWRFPAFSADGKRLLVVRAKHEVVEVTLDGSAAPVVRWTSTMSIWRAIYAPDGDGFLLDLIGYAGDLWLAEGKFG